MSDGHDHQPSEHALRAEALEKILTEKGLVTTEQIDEIIRLFEEDIGPMNGARVVARAWSDTPSATHHLVYIFNGDLG